MSGSKKVSFITQKRKKAENDFEKVFYKLFNNSFYGILGESFRNRKKIEFMFKDDDRKIIRQQSKLTFKGIHKSYTNYDSYAYKQNEVLWINQSI